MFQKKNLVILIILSCFTITAAQTIDQIKKDSKYLWGEGSSTNPNLADKQALSHLISQISVQVESSFLNIIEETGGNIEEYTEKVVNTYSNVMLNEAKMKQEEQNGRFRVLRYMNKDQIKNIFKEREYWIMEFIRSGNKACQDYRIGDALKYYYWSLCLLKSHPDMNAMRGDEAGMNGLLFACLPQRIENILDSVNVSIKSAEYIQDEKRKVMLLEFKYGKETIANLDYVYWTGDNWMPKLISVNSGKGIVEYYGPAARDMKEVKLRIEYMYQEKAKTYIAVNSVIENTYPPYFPEAQKVASSLFISRTPKKEKVNTVIVGDFAEEDTGTPKRLTAEKEELFVNTVLSFIDAYDKGNLKPVENEFTETGKAMIEKLMRYGRAEMIRTGEIQLKLSKLNDQYLVRSIPFKFMFPNNNREFIEEVVFILNKEGKIDGINFALSQRTIEDIMNKDEGFGTLMQKQQIVHFMESYKTAYCLENIDYIEKIFSDKALIIIGQKIETAENIDKIYASKLSNDSVVYIKMNKSDFITRLRRIFNSNEAINIHFEETDVKKVNRHDDFVYGIQIAQNYYSTSYADFGYLFLMFDLNRPQEPKIYVRSWQPEKSKDGRIIGLEDFIF
ncbi:LPP20 family lipoprotein [bacterium]|nr:LPP20 family lipoprotein [bacterium]